MEHKNIIWNPGTKQWFGTTCGRTSDSANIEEARAELDKHKCIIPSLDVAGAAPVTETIRLIRNPTKMALRTERSVSRFAVKTDEGKVLIRQEVFRRYSGRVEVGVGRIRTACGNDRRAGER